MEQMSFDALLKPAYKITKPIRLIELFAGIGAQAKALERLGVPFEHYRICEFDKYAVKSYNAIHHTNFETSDITKLKGSDLGIVDKDKYEYIMTYSFPCQDISIAGNQKGYSKGSGTRSGLLWQVERLLKECEHLPQILLMENVKQVVSDKNKADFNEWCKFLESKGYSNYWKILNAKDFDIPQNRERCFMVSILGNYYYEFPKGFPLTKRLKDVLEDNVDEKYYLSDKGINFVMADKRLGKYTQLCDESTEYVKSALTAKGNTNWTGNFIKCTVKENYGTVMPNVDKHIKPSVSKNFEREYQQIISSSKDIYQCKCKSGFQDNKVGIKHSPTIRANNDNTFCLDNNFCIRKLTPLECFRLMDFDDSDYDAASKVNSNSQLYKQAGNSICVGVLCAIFKELI